MAFDASLGLKNSLSVSQASWQRVKLSSADNQVRVFRSSSTSSHHVIKRSLVPSLSFGGKISTRKVCRSLRVKAKMNKLNSSALSHVCGSSGSFDIVPMKRIQNTPSIRRYGSPRIVARLFGPSIFEASKLRVFFLGIEDDKHPREHPRTYTLTHSDITAKLTLAISREINKSQIMGWYSRLQRDEVLAEWRKVQGQMSLHVHCHISGGNWLHNVIAKLRFYIFRKELPVVLEAFLHGDQALFDKHPDLKNALVWVYFQSNVKEYNRVECWGPLVEAEKKTAVSAKVAIREAFEEIERQWPKVLTPQEICAHPCECCSRSNLIPWPENSLID